MHFVVVFNLTRFARDKYDHFALRSHLQSLGISLRSATEPIDDTSTGKLMEGVLAAFAQFDNDCRSDRTRAGMKAALELGRWVFLAPVGYLNAPRAMGKSLMPDPERAPLVRRAFRSTRPGASPSNSSSSSQELGLDQPARPSAHISSDRRAAAEPALCRHRRRHRVRRSRKTRRLRAADLRGPVLQCASGLVRAISEHHATAAGAPGLPVARLRALRVLWSRPHRQLVEGPKRVVRVLPLPPWLPRGQRDQGQTRRTVRRRTRAAAADAGLHAATQGIRCADLEGAESGRARKSQPLSVLQSRFRTSWTVSTKHSSSSARSTSRRTTATPRNFARSLRSRGSTVTQASSMNSTWRASSRSQNAFCRAPLTSGCRHRSNNASGSNNCSFPTESHSTEKALLEPA